jgi:hypothetical protein
MIDNIEVIEYKRPQINKPIENIRFIKAAIIRRDKVYTGWRHSEIMRHMRECGEPYVSQEDQGFIDQEGFFYRRKSCSFIAYENKQVNTYKDPLTSEDLWDVNGNPV